MALFDTIRAGASGAVGGYEVQRSIRFNDPDNTYLTYIPSSDGNRQKWTWSGWVKRVRLDTTTYGLFTSQNDGDGGGNNGVSSIYFHSDGKLHVYYDTTGSNHSGAINDNMYRDINAWYHIVWQVDAANSTSKIFVNGVSQTIGSGQQPVSGYNYTMNQSGKRMTYGIEAWDLNSPASSYLAECHYSDGQLYDADVFAETDAETGQWVPKASPSITYGTNGHYLNFSDNSSVSALGTDFSGQGNNFTVSNLSVSSGDGNDSVTDTPTLNKATLNPTTGFTNNATLRNGNLEMTGSSGFKEISTIAFAGTSKFYYEVVNTARNGWQLVGVFVGQPNNPSNALTNTAIWGFASTQATYFGGSYTSTSDVPSWTNNDVMAIKYENGSLKLYKNGSLQTANTNSVPTGSIVFAYIANDNQSATAFARFSSDSWTQASGAGVDATWELSSANLPDPTIALPTEHFDPLLYTGNGGTNAISGLDFQPDWVWLKKRNGSTNHLVFDSVRGINRSLNTNGTGAEDTSSTNKLTSFNSDGFTVGSNSSANNNGDSYVAWNWKAGTSFSNSAGYNGATIASTGSVNQSAGFSIVSYTGNATRDQLVYHGLNAAPKWMLIKRRDGDNWIGYHGEAADSNPQQYYYEFQNEDARKGANTAFMWDDIVPSSNVFGIYSDGAVNNNGSTIIAYVFAEVADFSKFGHYIGNGNSDGCFIYLGFRPSLVIVKSNAVGEPWVMYDNKRNIGNPMTNRLRANSSSSEDSSSGRYKDFYANGFKARGTSGEQNSNGQRYIYMAWAESPFKYARAR